MRRADQDACHLTPQSLLLVRIINHNIWYACLRVPSVIRTFVLPIDPGVDSMQLTQQIAGSRQFSKARRVTTVTPGARGITFGAGVNFFGVIV